MLMRAVRRRPVLRIGKDVPPGEPHDGPLWRQVARRVDGAQRVVLKRTKGLSPMSQLGLATIMQREPASRERMLPQAKLQVRLAHVLAFARLCAVPGTVDSQ